MANLLYLLEMGMNDNNILTDIKNHRVRTVENIDIIYNGEKYNMFFEFTQCTHWNYRTTNKRTGAPLKKAIKETLVVDGLHMDTQFERLVTNDNGYTFEMSYRKCDLEREVWDEHHKYTKKDILEIINRYAVKKYDGVVLIEKEAKHIINTIGGWREKDIIKKRDFQTEGDYYYKIGDTWNDEHKVVEVYRREWEPLKNGRRLVETNSIAVDLVTGKITG